MFITCPEAHKLKRLPRTLRSVIRKIIHLFIWSKYSISKYCFSLGLQNHCSYTMSLSCICFCRSWRRTCNWNASVMASRAPAPPKPAGLHFPSSASSVTFSKRSMSTRCTWNQSKPAATSAQNSSSSRSPTLTGSPWTRTWCTLTSLLTTARWTL